MKQQPGAIDEHDLAVVWSVLAAEQDTERALSFTGVGQVRLGAEIAIGVPGGIE